MADDQVVTDAAAPEPDRATSRKRWGIWHLVAGLAAISLVAMWGYVTYLAFFEGRQPPVDRLDDPAFAEAAEERCADAVALVGELPGAAESPTQDDRAGVLDTANDVFADLLDDLETTADLVPAGEQRDRVTAWLTDWRVFLEDREDFAERLRTEPDARMLVSEKPGTGRHITGWIDEFANANRMPSCISPGDA